MSNLLITLIVVYIATIIIQIGYCIAWYENDYTCRDKLAIIFLIACVFISPIMILLEIGVALLNLRVHEK